CLQGHVTPFTF
nr:immunoglobulin light chain junction region [Macaca mulatta]